VNLFFSSGSIPLARRTAIVPVVAVLSILSFTTSLHAEMFSYYTTGSFTASGTNVLLKDAGSTRLTYTGQGSAATPAGSPLSPEGSLGTNTEIGLGQFLLEDLNGSANSNSASFNGETFTLSIFQVTPFAGGSPGGGTLIGSLSGTFTSPPNSDSVTMTVAGVVTAPGVNGGTIFYSPDPNPETFAIRFNTPTTLEGLAQSTPLPSSGVAGLVLLGLFGGFKLRTRLFGIA